MKEKIIKNPDQEYYVVSLKHTNKKDKYMTLWRPNNAGYCWPLELAGVYNGYEPGYHHHDGENIAVRVSHMPKKFITVDDQGRDCIKVSKEAISFFKSYQP